MVQLVKKILLQGGRPGFDPWVGKIPWRRERLSIPILWPGAFHGLYSPWGHRELDTTEQLSFHITSATVNKRADFIMISKWSQRPALSFADSLRALATCICVSLGKGWMDILCCVLFSAQCQLLFYRSSPSSNPHWHLFTSSWRLSFFFFSLTFEEGNWSEDGLTGCPGGGWEFAELGVWY